MMKLLLSRMKPLDGGVQTKEAPPLKVYMSRPDWNEPGGPTGHLPALISEMARHDGIDLRTFKYGFRAWAGLPRRFCEPFPMRLWIMLSDICIFVFMCLRHGKPDVLHLNSAFEKMAIGRDIPYLLICRIGRFGAVIKTHGSNDALLGQLSFAWRSMRDVYFRAAQVITFLSPVEAQQFRYQFPKYASKFQVAKNIVTDSTAKGAEARRGQILFGGRFVEKKNIPNMLEGFAEIARESPDAHLVMAGNGPLEPSLHQLAKTLGIADRITWTGWIDRKQLRALSAKSQITLFTSTGSEGMPMMLVEALNASGRIVTTSVRWTRSYPINSLGVLELAGPSSAQIAEGLRAALPAPPIDADLRQRRKVFLNQFSAATVVDEFLAHYRLTFKETANG